MKDINIPIERVRELAEQGHPEAQYNLGVYYANGDGVKQDYGEAAKWWIKSAEQGYADSFDALKKLIKMGVIKNPF